MTRLDHNRALSQLAKKTGSSVNDIRQLTIWGNHSATQYPDWSKATIGGRPAEEVVGDRGWLEDTFIPTVAKRGAPSSRRAGRARLRRPRTPPSTTSTAG
jgi:malate dehydrogenase